MNLDLGRRIGELFYEHDCVIIPQFGGFVANPQDAQLNEKSHTISPPSKRISFNQRLTHNDGLLAHYLSRKESVGYDAAVDFLLKEADRFRQDLLAGRRIELNTVGVLYRDRSGAVRFVPDTEHNHLKDSFGLGRIFLTPIEEEKAPVQEETPVVPLVAAAVAEEGEERKPSRRRWIAAAIMLPLVAAGGWLLSDQMGGKSNINFAGLNPFGKSVTAEYIPRIEDENIIFDHPDASSNLKQLAEEGSDLKTVYFSFEEDRVSPDGILVRLAEEEKPVIAEGDPTRMEMWFVVGGAFREESNAKNLVSTLQAKGYESYIFGQKNGLHLVCYGSYTNKAAAREALGQVKANDNPNAWLKKH